MLYNHRDKQKSENHGIIKWKKKGASDYLQTNGDVRTAQQIIQNLYFKEAQHTAKKNNNNNKKPEQQFNKQKNNMTRMRNIMERLNFFNQINLRAEKYNEWNGKCNGEHQCRTEESVCSDRLLKNI